MMWKVVLGCSRRNLHRFEVQVSGLVTEAIPLRRVVRSPDLIKVYIMQELTDTLGIQ